MHFAFCQWQFGEDLIVHVLLSGVSLEGLDLMRFRKFASKVMLSSSSVHTLPSTSADAVFHSQRVHLQVYIWASNNDFVPENWGLDWYKTIYDQ